MIASPSPIRETASNSSARLLAVMLPLGFGRALQLTLVRCAQLMLPVQVDEG
jgi:hypothetical protein